MGSDHNYCIASDEKCLKGLTILFPWIVETFKLNIEKQWPTLRVFLPWSPRHFFGCLWFRSRIIAHNKLTVALRQNSSWATLHQSLSSNLHCKLKSSSILHCKLKSTKVPVDLCLDKARFLIMAHRKQLTLCSERFMKWERNARKGEASEPPLVSLSNFSGLLWYPPQELARAGQNVSLDEISWKMSDFCHQNIC